MERRLVELARGGDRAAFGELAAAITPRLFAIAHRILRDYHGAEDATQQAIVLIWRQLPRLADPDRFQAWAYRIAVHACYKAANQRRRDQQGLHLLAPVGVEDSHASVADRDLLERAFDRLRPEQRAVLVLHYYLDLDHAEIASILDIPVGTVRSRAFNARTAMRAAIEADARPGVVGKPA